MVVLDLFESGLATKLLRRIDGGNSGEGTEQNSSGEPLCMVRMFKD